MDGILIIKRACDHNTTVSFTKPAIAGGNGNNDYRFDKFNNSSVVLIIQQLDTGLGTLATFQTAIGAG
jgi:hypothetical protein